jgi:hypothetical protein
VSIISNPVLKNWSWTELWKISVVRPNGYARALCDQSVDDFPRARTGIHHKIPEIGRRDEKSPVIIVAMN